MSSLNAQQIASLLQQQGFAKKDIPTMTAISLAESGGRPQAFNPRGLDESYGLFQVNMYGNLGPARMKQFGLKSRKDLFNPTTNVKAAKQILESQGLGAWSVYKGGQYKQYLPQAEKAAAALEQPQAPPLEQPQAPPKETAAHGRTFLIFKDTPAQIDPRDFLGDYMPKVAFVAKMPMMKPVFDPVSLLTQAALQTPNYLGDIS